MQPIVYAHDLGKAEGRKAWLAFFLGVAIAAAGFVMTYAYGLQALGRGVVAGAVIPILLSLALPHLRRARGVHDWLRLDGEGLTLGRRSLERHWRWHEISGFKRHGRLNPAALFRGRFVTLSASGSPRNVAIGDDYLTPIGEIAERLDEYLTRGSAGAGRIRHGTAPERPAVFWDRELEGTDGTSTSESVRNLVLWGLGLGLVAIGAVAYVAGWPPDWALLKEALTEHSWIYSALFGVALMPLAQLGRVSAMGNFLLLSSDGLHIRRQGQRRHWRWRELSAFELRRQDPGLSADGQARQVITFTARGDGMGAVGDGKPDTVNYSIDDIYDTPLGEIARRLDSWRLYGPPSEAASDHGDRPTADFDGDPASAVDTVAFRRRATQVNSAAVAFALGALTIFSTVELAVLLGFTLYVFPDLSADLSRPTLIVGAAIFAIVSLAVPVLLIVAIGIKANALELDGEGLTYRRLGRRRRWSWLDLSAFELGSGKLVWGQTRSGLVTFHMPEDDLLSRFLRWAYGINATRPTSVIEDIYDVPLDGVARQLNDYRERASRAGLRRGATT